LGSEQLLFYAFAATAIAGSLLVVGQRNPVYSVLAIIGSFFGLSGLYVLLEAPFVAVVQIIIYAGAIMVLFLFVVMLLNVPREDAAEWDRAHPLYRPGPMRLGSALAVALIIELAWALWRAPGGRTGIADAAPAVSSVRDLGRVLFTDYMFAFEVTSILIIAAMVGAVVLARKHGEER
jgi:NADH-quinone oxidoreductase subunit J